MDDGPSSVAVNIVKLNFYFLKHSLLKKRTVFFCYVFRGCTGV